MKFNNKRKIETDNDKIKEYQAYLSFMSFKVSILSIFSRVVSVL